MVEPIPTCQINANRVTWHCLYFPQSILSLHWVIKARIIENTRGSKNCPNEWPFCLAYYSMGFYPNHMTHGSFLSHDVIVAYIIITSGSLLMSALHTILISQKWANIGAVFWATVCMLMSLTHPNLIAMTCHLSGYVLMYLIWYTLTYFYFSISFWLINSLINNAEHLSLNCMTSLANYFTFLLSAFLSCKVTKSSPKCSSTCLSSQLN